MRRLLKILGWTFGSLAILIAGCVAHANYRIAKDEVNTIDAGAPGRFFTVQGHRLHVQTLGDPAASTHPPLLLVHGFIMSGHTSFLPWARESLAAERALILPDSLGYGYSERIPASGDHYTLKSHARDLAGLLDRLGVQQVDVAGHSWGGVIAAQFALDYPHRVRRLAIIDGGFYVYQKGSPLENVTYLPLGIGRSVVWHVIGGGPVSYVGRVCRAAGSCEGAATVRIKDSTDAIQSAMRTSRTTTGMADIEAALGRIDTETLVLWGEFDQVIPLTGGERLAREMPNARLAVVKDAWHMPWLEEPEETARQLLAFLNQ